MKQRVFTFILCLSLFVISCTQPARDANSTKADNTNNSSPTVEVVDDALHFYVIGDWGRNGHQNQQEVADQMNKTASVLEPEFIISTGDNFYDNGIASVDDPYWISSFENVYNGEFMFVNWYVVLGNHDYRGNPDAEIAYTQKSRRWNMPARYFTVDKEMEDGSGMAKFVFIDTSPFEDEYYEEDKYKNAVSGQDTAAQYAWIDSTLAASQDAKWLIVVGHHPFYTSGKRVDDEAYVRNHLEPLFEKHKVDMYFAGHEHDLQHQKPADVYTNHFVSGAGSEVRPTGKTDFTKFAESQPGFMSASLTANSCLIQAINEKGQVIYKTELKR